MLISYDCPKCLKTSRGEFAAVGESIHCPHCEWSRPIRSDDLNEGAPTHCLICGCQDLWRQKDFDQRLGVFIVGTGILLSTIAVAYMRPGLAMMILMAFGLADWILYAVLPDRLVCYRCHAQYHRIPDPTKTAAFDLELNERYRQEAIRLKQVEAGSKP